ncbi:hypothetical protein NHH03_21275 [Stieleria sp. TO1_6]|uniref:hypothetical protein n=1 Tax=Stieleria tagensis TaxID=2956795 RepID=UPI00209B6F70|nr:hypothetical protein [Stieleria tagensis]MCO8124288.1 hypothetical protein [Stieleria tagensis]
MLSDQTEISLPPHLLPTFPPLLPTNIRRTGMQAEPNPYSPPSTTGVVLSPAMGRRFVGRSFIASMLAGLTAVTGLLTGTLWSIGAIDLGRFGFAFLSSLAVGTALLVCVARCYLEGSRATAVVLFLLVPCIIFSATLLALRDAGVFTLF